MYEEKIYKYGDYVVRYVSDGWDSGCLTISKIQNDNMYVIGEITGGIAEIIDFILDSVEDEISKYESKLDKIKEYCELNKEFTPRLEDILELLEKKYKHGHLWTLFNSILVIVDNSTDSTP